MRNLQHVPPEQCNQHVGFTVDSISTVCVQALWQTFNPQSAGEDWHNLIVMSR